MGNCSHCTEDHRGTRALVPALAFAALAGVALTYFLTKKTRGVGDQTPIEKVIDLCSSAADKLDAFTAQSRSA